jgi:uncharacterized protein YceH (UPF0502 family)
MNFVLNDHEVRVLGALIEKDITTPDYYPMSLNALVNACNQKSNREPVMELSEDEVRAALVTLEDKDLAGPTSSADSRVTKYEHRLDELYNLTRGETALLCILLLRGPQTPGELRGRTERMFHFEELSDVQAALQRMMTREPSMVKAIPRQPGTKESRYTHLLAGDVPDTSADSSTTALQGRSDRSPTLAEEVKALREDVAELQRQFAEFKKQFE